MISGKTKSSLCHVLLKPHKKENFEDSKTSVISEVLENSRDIFSKYPPPRIPPKRNIEMKIDLESG